MALLERTGLGACLADDMGLGKTAMVLALVLDELNRGGRRTSAGPAPPYARRLPDLGRGELGT